MGFFLFLLSGVADIGEFQLVLSEKCKRDGFLCSMFVGFS